MRRLFHLPLSPFCRKTRMLLSELELEFELQVERVWDRREEFLALNPAGKVPVVVEPDGTVLSDSQAICEFLEEIYDAQRLLGRDAQARAEVRRLVNWFDDKFHEEVTALILYEKVNKRLMGQGTPDSTAIRAGLSNITYHLDYIAFLTDRRNYLAGDTFSLADIAAAAHLSCLDYIDAVPWHHNELAKEWYARVKSRRSFRPLLGDQVPGIAPPNHYANLDF
jgi:glutathione S-transferase